MFINGSEFDHLTFQHLGDRASLVNDLASGSHEFSKALKAAKKPMIVLGSQALEREDGAALLRDVQSLGRTLTQVFI